MNCIHGSGCYISSGYSDISTNKIDCNDSTGLYYWCLTPTIFPLNYCGHLSC